ncbi:efflux RND transporter periplasmic adaptor subunit [Tamlana agarivorans]|uniref:Efflux RND transporter periplasmic adaptor subunit n=1 Tax=Pseudotamlana agarivorans TaxID=481183 RepID=A0ACC5U5Y6_9FLAO|nr:efflux RND transporter periplasmic adaptor subunit [Tamlana agarivorans]MBU2949721.1 efflux RND transporter periplasmic adaptor subunit [Tamlana agarivorans]
MKKRCKLCIPIIVLGSMLILSACKENASAVSSIPEIEVIKSIKKDVPIEKEFVGQIYGFQDIPIRARVEGFLEGVHFNEGFPVKKGQLLYTIDSQPFVASVASMESVVAEAKTYLVNAENELARYKPLAKINAVSKSDLDAAQASRDAAISSVEAAQANLRMAQIDLSYTKILSPIDGLIGKTEARKGEFVGREPNPVILNVVSDIEKMRVEFFLTESEYLSLARHFELDMNLRDKVNRKNSKNNLTLILGDGTIYEEKGSVEFLGRNIDANTGSILVQASFSNKKGLLRPGMYAKVRVQFEIAKDAILVPQKCITEIQGQYFVYVIEEGNVVKSRTVKTGGRIGDLWLISEGVKENELIIIDGLQKVTSGMTINPVVTEFKSQISKTN